MEKEFQWRVRLAVAITIVGMLYYVVFLIVFIGGIPIEHIHEYITGGWPTWLADIVPLLAPAFLAIGALLWYYHYARIEYLSRPAPEQEYKFEFKKVSKSTSFKPLKKDSIAAEEPNIN